MILRPWQIPILSYNTTPAEKKPLRWKFASLLSKAFDHIAWPRGFGSIWPHISVGCFRADHIVFFSAYFPLAAATARLMLWPIFRWPHINHSALGFDHIFDHKQNRSTRRHECTRVWKSRFCVAERAKKTKTAQEEGYQKKRTRKKRRHKHLEKNGSSQINPWYSTCIVVLYMWAITFSLVNVCLVTYIIPYLRELWLIFFILYTTFCE